MTFSIIIPIFNEKNNISLLVSKIKSSLKNYKYEIIIVDDSSPDNTYKVAKDKFKNRPTKVFSTTHTQKQKQTNKT